MSEVLNQSHIVSWLRTAAATIKERKDLLTELDKSIGDGDHGINMDRGFQKVLEQLDSREGGDLSSLLRAVAMALITSVGGASGPLYGTFFLRASTAVAGQEELSGSEVLKLLEAGLEGVRQRGKAQPGDKTMIDALQPAVQAFGEALADKNELPIAMARAAEAARGGAEATVPLVARKGRASYLGERSVGHQDPGATSTFLIIEALRSALS